jgi:ferredoxin-NADP reductase
MWRRELSYLRGAGNRLARRIALRSRDAATRAEISDLCPRNLFPLHQAERVLLLAAGIGITPLYAMALQLKAAGTPFTLHYYVKRRESAAFARELSRFGECQIHTASPRTALAEHLPAPEAGLHAWICGPAGFMEKVRDVATARDGMMAIFTARRFSPRPLPHAVTRARSLRSNSPPPGSAGRCLRIRPSLRYYRKTAWTCRFHAKWGSAGVPDAGD